MYIYLSISLIKRFLLGFSSFAFHLQQSLLRFIQSVDFPLASVYCDNMKA